MDNNELKMKAFSGALWKFAERIGAQLVSLFVSIVLARLLTPEDYSVVGIVTIFFALCNVFITGGFNAALIRKKNADKEDYATVFYISMSVAVLLYGVLYFTAPAIAKLYAQPLLVPIFRVMGLSLPLFAAKSVVSAYISNQLQFKKYFFATLGGTIVSAVVGIVMAVKGFGPWALVAQNLVNSGIGTVILFLVTRLRIPLAFSWAKLKDLLDYSWKIFAASLITAIYDEVNPLIIGLKFSANDLSFYTKGRAYPALLNTSIDGTLSAVLFPVISKVTDDKEAVLRYTRRFFRVSSFIVFPVMIGFFAVSDNFIRVLLTEKWMPAAPYVKIFCLSYMFNIIQNGNLQTIRAVGRSDINLKLEIIIKTLYLVVIVTAVFLSDSPVALATTTLINTTIAILVNSAPNKKIIGYGLRRQMMDILPNLLISSVMGVAVYALGALPVVAWILLPLQVLSGAAIYVLINLLIKNPDLHYLLQMIKGFFKKGSKGGTTNE